MDERENTRTSSTDVSEETFEMVHFMTLDSLTRIIYGGLSWKRPGFLVTLKSKIADFKKKHNFLLENMNEWKDNLFEEADDVPILENLIRFLKYTMKFFLGSENDFLFLSKEQIGPIAKSIASFFDPASVGKRYVDLINFGKPHAEMRPASTKSLNRFIFEYLIGLMSQFFIISQKTIELKYMDRDSIDFFHLTSQSDSVAQYLSGLVYNPTMNEVDHYVKELDLVKLVFDGDVKKIVKRVIGSKVMKQLDESKKLTLQNYFKGFSRLAKLRFTSDFQQTGKCYPIALVKNCHEVLAQGISEEILPEENIEKCMRKLHRCLQSHRKWGPRERLFRTLNPCSDPIKVEFIERLGEQGISPEIQKALFFNVMYFVQIFVLQVISIYKYFRYEANRLHFYSNERSVTVEIMESLYRPKVVRDPTTDPEKEESEMSDSTVVHVSDPNKKSQRMMWLDNVNDEEIVKHEGSVTSEKSLKREAPTDDDIQVCTPVKKPFVYVTLDSDSESGTV